MIVAVRGIDGSGKSTLVDRLAEEAPSTMGVTPIKFALFANPLYARVRLVVEAHMDDHLELYARSILGAIESLRVVTEEVAPANELGIAVCDRYVQDTIDYVDLVGGPLLLVRKILDPAPQPDLTLVLDIPVEEAAVRCERLGESWSSSFRNRLTTVRRRLLADACQRDPTKRLVIDATLEPREIVRCAFNAISSALG